MQVYMNFYYIFPTYNYFIYKVNIYKLYYFFFLINYIFEFPLLNKVIKIRLKTFMFLLFQLKFQSFKKMLIF